MDRIFYNEILMIIMKKIALLILLITSLACQRKEEIEGPLLDDLYGDFAVLEEFAVEPAGVDFASGDNSLFSIRFNKTVDWEIHVYGQVSGAEKILSGKSKVVDSGNGIWNGSTTLLPMFKIEECMAVITVEGEAFTDTVYTNIIDTKINEGFLLSDFENGTNPDWNIFTQSGADMSFFIVESNDAAQANHYYDMGGAVDWDYLIGYIDMPSSAYQEVTYPLSDDPSKVFFNVLLNKPPGITNEIVLWQFWEDDNLDGSFDANNEDMYSAELSGLENGWQTVSLRYDQIESLVNGAPSPPAGNGIHEPHKLLNIRLLFLANPASGYSQTLMDYMIFTENNALEP